MGNPKYATIIAEAAALLVEGGHDQAIDVLRSEGPVNDAELCALLARAYHGRGDSKGDLFSSHYFARRALQLGHENSAVSAILAVGAFRQERYVEANAAFSGYVGADSPAATRLIYGLSLFRAGRAAEAEKWIDSALADEPANREFQHAADLVARALEALQDSREGEVAPAMANMFTTATESLRRTEGAIDLASPYRHNALSKLRGNGQAAKDFHWLEKNIPCQAGCPAGTDIPGYLSAVYAGEYDEAYRINLWDNVFPGVLGRVCARPCESACRHGWEGLGEPVAICWSKRAAADLGDRPPVVLEPLYPQTGAKVAVVGAGVAGLTAARNLALLGHAVTVFEKHSSPGGMMNQGIPEFRLPRDVIEREVEQIEAVGVDIRCDTEIGADLSMAELVAQHQAIVLAGGTLRPNLLDLPGKALQGIRHGLDFLLEVNETHVAQQFGKQVLVIGGGFTAMDCARTAWRLGADSVRVMYRRGKSEMLITPGELEELEREGIPMEFFVSPVAYRDEGSDRVTGIQFVRTQLGEADESGRRRPVPIPESEFEIPCDTVILATGQSPDTSWIDPELRGLLVGEDQWLKSGPAATTEHARIFAAGDFATGARSLIDAIGHAKDCARRVDRFLTGETRLIEVAQVTDAPAGSGRIREMDAVPVQHVPLAALTERKLTTEVEQGYDAELATEETQRCYLCHFKYEIDVDKCIFCEWCIKAKPRPDCIVRVSDLRYDEQERIVGFERAQSTEATKLIYINQEDCIRCNACVDACPVDCISIQQVSLRTATAAGRVIDAGLPVRERQQTGLHSTERR